MWNFILYVWTTGREKGLLIAVSWWCAVQGHGCDSFTRPPLWTLWLCCWVTPHITRGWLSRHLHALHRLSGALPPHADAFAFIACRVAASGTDLAPSHRTYAFFFVGRHESFRLSLLHRPGILQTVIEAAKGHSPREELPFPTVQRKTGQSRAKRGLTVTHFLTQTTTLHHKQYVWSCTVGGKRNTSAHSGGDVGSYATLRNVGNYFPQSLWPHTWLENVHAVNCGRPTYAATSHCRMGLLGPYRIVRTWQCVINIVFK